MLCTTLVKTHTHTHTDKQTDTWTGAATIARDTELKAIYWQNNPTTFLKEAEVYTVVHMRLFRAQR